MRVLNTTDLLEVCNRIQGLGVKDVLITGGEIYHAKDVLENVCKALQDSGISFSFSTAQILDKEFVNSLFKFRPRAFNVSLDPRDASPQGEKNWQIDLQGTEFVLKMAEECDGVEVKITGVVTSDNIGNFDEYFEIVKRLCRQHKSISAVYVTNPYDIGYVKDSVRAPEDKLNNIVEIMSQKNLPKAFKLVNFPRQNAPLQRCFGGSHYVHIEPNGNVYPCHLFANYNEEVFLMGNILHDNSAEIAQNLRLFSDQSMQAVRNFKKETRSCVKCDVAESCGGGCLAEVISVGQLIEPQLVCKYIPPPRPVKSFTPVDQPSLSLNSGQDLTSAEEEKIVAHIKSNLRHRKHDLAHGLDHTLCVVQLARFIAKKEKANLRIVTAASYFHDFAPRQELIFENHTKISAEKAVIFLKGLGFTEQDLSEIYLCIDTSSYGSSQLGKNPQSLEAKIVRDADWLDAIGARGIARVFAFAATHGCEVLGTVEWDPDNPPKKRLSLFGPDPSPIYHFFSKLLWVKENIQTATGKRIADQRHKQLVQFLKQYKAEMSPNPFGEEI